MIQRLADYLSKIPPVFVDGSLYVIIAVLASAIAFISSDDAAKYIEAGTLFWIKGIVTSLNAAAVALKMYRSTQYAEHREEKKKNGHTAFFNKPTTT